MAHLEHPEKRQEHGKHENISYASTYFPSTSDEDRLYLCASHSSPMKQNLSSFGVFDGHGGVYASSTLSTNLHVDIIDRFNSLQKSNAFSEFQSTNENVEACFCEAIWQSFQNADLKIKEHSNAGSTAVSIFIIPRNDGSIRVICPWVGDSRCVLYQLTSNNKMLSTIMSQDHKPNLKREIERVENRLPARWRSLPMEVNHKSFKSDEQTYDIPSMNEEKVRIV